MMLQFLLMLVPSAFTSNLDCIQSYSKLSNLIISSLNENQSDLTLTNGKTLNLSFDSFDTKFILNLTSNDPKVPLVVQIWDGVELKDHDHNVLTWREANSSNGFIRLTTSSSSSGSPDLSGFGAIHIRGSIHKSDEIYEITTIKEYSSSRRTCDIPVYQFDNGDDLILLKAHSTKPYFQNDLGTMLFKRDIPQLLGCGVTDDHIQGHLNLQSKLSINDSQKASTCPLPTKKLLAMGVAADCSYTLQKGGVSQSLQQILTTWNSASAVYESTFNIQLGVAKVMLQQSCSLPGDSMNWNVGCSQNYSITSRLSDFSKWRGTQQDSLGLYHLMTACATQPAVGIAWLGTLCQTTASQQNMGGVPSFVSGTGVSSIVPVQWKVVAHEIGHSFGAIHDCTSTLCSNACSACSPDCDCGGKYIMNPLDSSILDTFSPASIALMCDGISKLGTCLQNPGASLLQVGVCGNGVKEAGEECDCGPVGSTSCKNGCCNPSTCKLAKGVCDPLNEVCCSDQCQFKESSEVCHRGDEICDLTTTCPGTSGTCPSPFRPTGDKCVTPGGISATCASGLCTSRDLQCVGNGSAITVKACPQFSGCEMNCANSNGDCFQLTGNFVDGTICGGDGRCGGGQCSGSTVLGQIGNLVQSYPQFAYPIIVIIGLIILGVISGLLRRCWGARRNRMNRIRRSNDTLVGDEVVRSPSMARASRRPLRTQSKIVQY